MFRYEMHIHSSSCSACSSSTAKEMVVTAKEKGYTGIVFTNHFYYGNTAVNRKLPWREFVEAYKLDWLEAKEYGDSMDFDVLFGLEEVYEPGKEALIYGISPQLIADTPEIKNMEIKSISEFVRNNGGFIACAHPFRDRPYIPKPYSEPNPALFDAVEAYNSGNTPKMNEKAFLFAKKYNMPCISGGDVHEAIHLGDAGLAFHERIRTNEQLVRALKDGKYRMIVNGVVE